MKPLKPTVLHSVVYGLGNVFSKLIGFILLPLYTSHISVAEYGILGVLEVTMLILTQVLNLGQSQSYLRYYNHADFRARRREIASNILLVLFIVLSCFVIIGRIFSEKIAAQFSTPGLFQGYFNLVIVIVAFRIVNLLFFSILRAWEKSLLYTVGNVSKFLLVLLANIYFVALVKLGITGILYSYIIGEIVIFTFFFFKIIPTIKFSFNRSIMRDCLRFGLPFIFTALAGMLLNMGDRYLLKLLVNYREVGLYSLGYKVAGVLNIFLIQSFSLSFLPQAYKIYGTEGDKTYYSKMLTYLLFVLFWAGLFLAVFSRKIIRLFALNSEYWQASVVIPLIVLAYIISGAKHVVSLGLYLKQRSGIMAVNTILAVVLNIGLNLILIPVYKMTGAALATIISFGFLFGLTLFRANRCYHISYEYGRILIMTITALIVYFIQIKLIGLDSVPKIIIGLMIILSYPILLYLPGFYQDKEIRAVKKLIGKYLRKRK